MSPLGRLSRRARRAKVLFFSRGRGRGHAVPDMAIAEELRQILPDLRLRFVSYGKGAATLVEGGYSVIDLGLPEDGPFLQGLAAANRLLAAERPEIVVAHEEFSVLPLAKSLGLPACFIVDFFTGEKSLWMEALQYADEILFIERRGLFPEPPYLKGKVRYIGPVVRAMSATRADRSRVRRALGLAESARVVSVIPGAWATEKRAPIFDLVTAAFQLMSSAEKKLVWVAGEDYEALRRNLEGMVGAMVMRSHWPIEELMVASDLVITKANRGTTIDLANLGVPSLSLSHGLNPVDETIIPHIRSNQALDARSVDGEFLCQEIEGLLRDGPAAAAAVCDPAYASGGAARAARELARFIEDHTR